MRTFFIWAGFHRLGRDDLTDHLIVKASWAIISQGRPKHPARGRSSNFAAGVYPVNHGLLSGA